MRLASTPPNEDPLKKAVRDWQHVPVAAGLLLLAFAMFFYALRNNLAFAHDDAYIAMRYARNLLAGRGLVWNEGEWVEGYSSLLMVLLNSLVCVLLPVNLLTGARIVNLVAVVFLAGYLILFLRSRAPAGQQNAVAMVLPSTLILGSAPMAIWVCGALEGPLYATVCTLAVCAVIQVLESPGDHGKALWAGLAIVLPALTRPDGLFFVVLGSCFCLARLLLLGREGVGAICRGAATCAIPTMALFVWRYRYYGDWLPNTVYAKASGLSTELIDGGWAYLISWMLAPPFLLLLAIGLLFYSLRSRQSLWAGWWLTVVLLGYGGMIGYVGGDFMPAHRLLLPLVPICALAVGLVLVPVLRKADRRETGLVTGLAVAMLLIQLLRPGEPADPAAFVGSLVGRHVAANWPPSGLVASNNAGSLPFYAKEHRFVDMLGLNDAHIARRRVDAPRGQWQRLPGHAKGDGAYVLSRRPEYIILGPAEGTSALEPWFLSDFELAESAAFRTHYRERRQSIDVRHVLYHENYPPTRTGVLEFIYYERID